MHSTTNDDDTPPTYVSRARMEIPTNGRKRDSRSEIPLKSSSELENERRNNKYVSAAVVGAEDEERQRKFACKYAIGALCLLGVAFIIYIIMTLSVSESKKANLHFLDLGAPNSQDVFDSELGSYEHAAASTDKLVCSNTARPTNAQKKESKNEIPLKSSSDLENERKNNKYVSAAVVAAEEEEHQRKRTNMLKWAKRLAIGALCLLGVAFIIYIIMTLSFSESKRVKLRFFDLDAPNSQDVFDSELGSYEHAAVSTDKQVCSNIASNIMLQGGSAVDSAISAALCNGIVTLQSMGIGGGMLMNVYIRNERKAYSIDANSVAPLIHHPDLFAESTSIESGAASILVPGEVMGYHIAHQRFGKLPWKKLVEPAIKICEDGFYLSKHMDLGLSIKRGHTGKDKIIPDIFNDPVTGEQYPVGTKLKPRKQLCETLKLLAENGPLDFYNGTLAKLVVDDLRDIGSTISEKDLESYKAYIRTSIATPFQNGTMYVMPPVSSGAVLASVLSTLEGYNFTKRDWNGKENQALTMHRLAEALKYGFAKRWELGDLSFFDDVDEVVKNLTNPELNRAIRAQINDFSVHNKISDYGAKFSVPGDHGTAQLSFFAPNGDAVSVTSTIHDSFGSGEIGKRTGIIFNGAMDDFTIKGKIGHFLLPPSPKNIMQPRMRAMSSMSPTILVDKNGDVRLVIGGAGGTKIISVVAYVTAAVLWLGQNLKEAIDAPRFDHQLEPNYLNYELNRVDNEILKLLESRGQHTKSFTGTGSVINAIYRNKNLLYANADYRRRGAVSGF